MGRGSRFDSDWRRAAMAIYDKPTDGRILGTYEVDVTKSLAFLKEKKSTDEHYTLTHLMIAAISRALKNDVPEMNCYALRGKIIERKSIGIWISVNIPNSNEITGFLVPESHLMGLPEIKKYMDTRVEKFKARKEAGAGKNKNILTRIPWPFRKVLVKFIRFITTTIGMELKFIHAGPESWGSVLLSNIGSFNIQYGFVSLMSISTVPAAAIMGMVQQKPVVRDGEIVIRDILPMAGSFDHRVIDGNMTGKMAVAIDRYMQEPETLYEKP